MINKLLFSLMILVLLATGSLFYLHFKSKKKIGYVTTMKVFEEFTLKKELEENYKKVQSAKQAYMDSLKTGLRRLMEDGKPTEEQLANYKQAYVMKEEQFNEEGQKLYDDYNSRIWEKLNQYMKDYGKENGYDYILGASGQGSLMYAKDDDDLTKDIINYVNLKYSDKKNK